MYKITDQSHSKQDIFLLLAKLFERASYFGLRAILVLSLIDEAIALPKDEALQHYALFTSGMLLFGIIGALLGDLLIGNKKALLIGGVLQTIGAFILSIPTTFTLYIGLGLVIIGGGLFTPNLFSSFGKSYLNRDKLLDSAFSIYYLAINLGAALGIFIIGIIGEKYGWSFGFILSGLLMLVSLILTLFHKESQQIATKIIKKTYDKALINIIVAFVALGLFWLINDVVSHKNMVVNYSYSESLNNPYMGFWFTINSYLMLPVSLICFSIWAYFYSNSYIKLCIGFLFGALSYGLLYFIPEIPLKQHVVVYLASILLFVISEAFIQPVVYSIITRYANPKYLAIIVTLFSIMNKAFFYFNGVFNDYIFSNSFNSILYSTFGMIFIGLVLLVFVKNDNKDRNFKILDS